MTDLGIWSADSYIVKEFLYPERDDSALSWMVLGVSVLALHNMGNWHLLSLAFMIMVERANKHLRQGYTYGVSGIYSQISGYLVAAQVFKKPSLLTHIWSTYLVLHNLVVFGVDWSEGFTRHVAHFEGHLVNFISGFLIGSVALLVMEVKVKNI